MNLKFIFMAIVVIIMCCTTFAFDTDALKNCDDGKIIILGIIP